MEKEPQVESCSLNSENPFDVINNGPRQNYHNRSRPRKKRKVYFWINTDRQNRSAWAELCDDEDDDDDDARGGPLEKVRQLRAAHTLQAASTKNKVTS